MPVGEIIVTIIVSCVGSSALFGFVQFLISRRDKKKGGMAKLIESIDELKEANKNSENSSKQMQLDICRLQLMTLIHMAPKNVANILELGKHYFVDLKGDSYLSTLFSQWLRDQHLEESVPEWFENYEEEGESPVAHKEG